MRLKTAVLASLCAFGATSPTEAPTKTDNLGVRDKSLVQRQWSIPTPSPGGGPAHCHPYRSSKDYWAPKQGFRSFVGNIPNSQVFEVGGAPYGFESTIQTDYGPYTVCLHLQRRCDDCTGITITGQEIRRLVNHAYEVCVLSGNNNVYGRWPLPEDQFFYDFQALSKDVYIVAGGNPCPGTTPKVPGTLIPVRPPN